MKKTITLIALIMVSMVNGQAFKGTGDVKGQVGLTLLDGGTGIGVSADYGIGEKMSCGIVLGYTLLSNNIVGGNPHFGDRTDLRVRFSTSLGDFLKLSDNMDIYPGLDLGLRNFGGHLGFRYFFTNDFGMFAEAYAPLAWYNSGVNGSGFTIGTSFNL